MPRLVIIGVIVGVAFTLYGLVDAAMTDRARARGLSKPMWVLLVILLPVIGAALWFSIGKDRGQTPRGATVGPPDDDPAFGGGRPGAGPSMTDAELDAHMRELEERLRELDDETFPGEERPNSRGGAAAGDSDEPRPER